MKNLNPNSGLRQICTGKLYLPRRLILELIRSKQLKPKELGYLIMAIISADWTGGEYRYGLIRHETKKLSTIWNFPYTTLQENLNKLFIKNLLSKKKGVYAVQDFDNFQTAGGQYSNKNSVSDEILEQIFGTSLLESEISDSDQTKVAKSLKIPYKIEFNTTSNLIVNQPIKTMADYQKIYEEGSYTLLLPDDMKWLDEHITADGRTIL